MTYFVGSEFQMKLILALDCTVQKSEMVDFMWFTGLKFIIMNHNHWPNENDRFDMMLWHFDLQRLTGLQCNTKRDDKRNWMFLFLCSGNHINIMKYVSRISNTSIIYHSNGIFIRHFIICWRLTTQIGWFPTDIQLYRISFEYILINNNRLDI